MLLFNNFKLSLFIFYRLFTRVAVSMKGDNKGIDPLSPATSPWQVIPAHISLQFLQSDFSFRAGLLLAHGKSKIKSDF